MNARAFIEYVAERDIDLLLLEELHSSASFRSWMIAHVLGPGFGAVAFVGAWHSLTDPGLGESDLVLLSKTPTGETIAILIENKIDAPPQPDQALRYREAR